MAAIEDFLQDSSGDLDLSGPDLQVTPSLETFVAQGLSESFQFWQGEWYLDLREGFPYFQEVIGDKVDRDLLQGLLRSAALKTSGVASVEGIALTFGGASRTLTARVQVRATDGEVVDVGAFIVGRPTGGAA